MSSTHISLDAAATDRKARLAKLASLKRKQPGSDTTIPKPDAVTDTTTESTTAKTDVYISGRNYDVAARAPKLGFENTPSDQETVEQQAERLSVKAAEQAAKDEAEAQRGIDLFKLQPKNPNWDLKRDLAEKMRILDVRTQNAIARLVRERIAVQKQDALKGGNRTGNDQGEEVGLDGSTLVEGVHLREREEEESERRDRELEEQGMI